jgi:hypothetical protein
VAQWPTFQAQGVVMLNGAPHMRDQPRLFGTDVSDVLFGLPELFCIRGCGPIARIEQNPALTDHEVVTRRLQWLIENSEVVDGQD